MSSTRAYCAALDAACCFITNNYFVLFHLKPKCSLWKGECAVEAGKVKLVKQADKKCISDREGLICQVGFCFVILFLSRLKSNQQKASKLKWDVTMKSNLLEMKPINHTVLHLVFFFA